MTEVPVTTPLVKVPPGVMVGLTELARELEVVLEMVELDPVLEEPVVVVVALTELLVVLVVVVVVVVMERVEGQEMTVCDAVEA